MVAAAFDIEVSTLHEGRRGEMNQAPKVAMYLVKRRGDLTLQAMATHFGVETYWEVVWACTQVRAKKDDRPPLQESGRAG